MVMNLTLRENCPNTEFFSGSYFPVFGYFSRSVSKIFMKSFVTSKTNSKENFI